MRADQVLAALYQVSIEVFALAKGIFHLLALLHLCDQLLVSLPIAILGFFKAPLMIE